MSRFEEETGISVRYTGSADFAADLRSRVAGGVNAPDVALVPRPGVIAQLIEHHDIVPLSPRTTGSSTGWPATDRVEDLLLRRAGTTAYDDGVAGRLAFDSPPVRADFEEFDAMVLGRGRTAGGLRSILQTPIMDASGPLFADPAGCAL